ncbi:hypothetical protein BGW80DRAFT_1465712 [Lactifluus volemus]|nr:hypothetical protein BGW80DRAFT_1465712 [Lactifluus volemus]
MDSDVEMLDQDQKSVPALVTSASLAVLPPSDSQQVSPIAPDVDDNSPDASLDDPPPSSDVSTPAAPAPPAPPPLSKTGTDGGSSSKGKGKPSSGKPTKSTKARAARSPSPSPPPPAPPPPPMQTIRLEIKLGGPEKYEVDVASLAKATGQRHATPPAAVKQYESESEGEGEGAPESGMGSDGGGAGGEKKSKKNLGSEYYDLTDPFIDDSELAIDERTFIAQTKQQGFYVFSGEVALLKEKSHRKPKSKKSALPAPEPIAGPSNYPHALINHSSHSLALTQQQPQQSSSSTKEVSIALLSDEEEAGEKRRTRLSAESPNGKKKRRVVDIHAFHPDLEVAIEELKAAISKENWEPKGKFPSGIRPVLGAVALKAIKLNEYNDNFFNLMPRIFPYNRFTMSKLIKRQIFPEHMALLVKRQDELLAELKSAADKGFPQAKEEWERSVTAWEKKQEKTKVEGVAGTASVDGSPASRAAPLPPGDDGTTMDVDKSGDGEGKETRETRDMHPPIKKYKMSETMKGLIWNLVCLSNECCRIENEKNTLEGSASQVSEQGLRKALYQKIVAAFPEGWMSSGQVSREVSVMKKKFEKEALENDS